MSTPPIDGFALAPQQRRVIALQGDAAHAPYRAWAVVRIDGPLDPAALARAWSALVARHEILRTVFRRVEGLRDAVQIIDDAAAPALALGDAAQPAPAELGPPSIGPLWRAALHRRGDGACSLHLRTSALCCDARGLVNLVGELCREYDHLVGAGPALPDALQVADLATWQNDLLQSADTGGGRRRWRELDLDAAVRTRVPGAAFEVHAPFDPRELPLPLPPALAPRLEALAASLGAELRHVLLAAWVLHAGRLTGRPELHVGVRCDGRTYDELRAVPGPFARVVPVPAGIEASASLGDLVRAVAASLAESARWQEFFEWPRGSADDGRAPYLPIAFSYDDDAPSVEAGGARFTVEESDAFPDRFDLEVAWRRPSGSLSGRLRWDAARITEAHAAALASQHAELLGALCEARGAPACAIELAPAAPPPPGEPTVPAPARTAHELFERHAAQAPGRTAIACGAAHRSYADLDRSAEAVARALRREGIGPEAVVGLLVDRSVELGVALLGVLKAGGAFLPLDVEIPPARLALMLEDARARAVIADERFEPLLRGCPVPVLRLAALVADGGRAGDRPAAAPPAPDHLAYVIFTSGSTGRPKGVGVTHAALCNYVAGLLDRLALPDGSSFAAVSTIAADLGHTAIFGALCGGGTLHLVPRDEARDPARFGDYMEQHAIDCLKIVPSHLSALLRAARDPRRLLPRRCLVVGGEHSTWQLVEQVQALAPGCAVVNHYGPTETTVGVATYRLGASPSTRRSAAPPIGRALPGITLRLLDDRMRPVALGVPGELHVGGAALARGYVTSSSAATAERFLPDPFGPPGARLYRTGDLARLLPGGELELLGRADDQVKLRGFRIEPGEIEAILARHPDVRDSRVVVREVGDEPQLVAYVVPRAELVPDAAALRRHLAAHLPDPMIPASFVPLEAIPLTGNGKLDRARLPAPGRGDDAARPAGVPPRDAVESALVGIYRRVLEAPLMGVTDDFFALGGHSLLAIQLVARLGAVFQLEVPVRLVFDHPTVAAMAAALRARDGAARVERIAALLARISGMTPEERARELARRRAEPR